MIRIPYSLGVARTGEFFFRWRSYLPLLTLPLLGVAIVRFQVPFASHASDLLWEITCVGLALFGLAIRVYTSGVAASGTSGRGTRRPKAASLSTAGPYSVVRHPLYLGNAIIATGLASFSHTWVAPPLVAVLVVGYYACIARTEERYLRERFGAVFEQWAARVPAVIPALSGYVPSAVRFDWRRAVRREFYAMTLVLVLPFVIDVAEDLRETGTLELDPLWTVTAALGAVLFVMVRLLKKRTTLLGR